jgi:hypothetical protein
VALCAALAAVPALLPFQPVEAASGILAFGCYRVGSDFVIALGNRPRPGSDVAMVPSTIQPLKGSGAFPVARLTTAIGNYPLDRRCTAIATRLTNLALATDSATPLGIIRLSQYLVAGKVGEQPVIAIDRVTLGDILATLPVGTDPAQSLAVINARLRAIAAGKAIAEAIRAGEVVEFQVIEIR